MMVSPTELGSENNLGVICFGCGNGNGNAMSKQRDLLPCKRKWDLFGWLFIACGEHAHWGKGHIIYAGGVAASDSVP
jgi:hypothetical protein